MDNVVRQIQLKCLELLDAVDAICRKHDISYSLCGGSVVGAHLYNGCLPWDDDIDLMMTRENYNRFLKVAKDELPEGFSVHNFNSEGEYWSLFTKIVNDNTTIVQNDGTVSGVFLDITVYDRIPKSWRSKEDILLWKISQVVMIGRVETKRLKDMVRNAALRLLFYNKRGYFRFFQRRVEKNAKLRPYHYSELFGAYCNTKPYHPSIFENYTTILFEGKHYMIVRDYIDYLQTRYERTDFYEPVEKQIAPHYKFVDFCLPYKQYVGANLK